MARARCWWRTTWATPSGEWARRDRPSRHSRGGGNPGRPAVRATGISACAGMTEPMPNRRALLHLSPPNADLGMNPKD
ncbi:MAG: hypothetical protein EOO30_20750 [Comamonadaceae bacterium]|nr:MAG: hypothetical protein EOO30_20750 [Comamonadaceae bacterium]